MRGALAGHNRIIPPRASRSDPVCHAEVLPILQHSEASFLAETIFQDPHPRA